MPVLEIKAGRSFAIKIFLVNYIMLWFDSHFRSALAFSKLDDGLRIEDLIDTDH